MLIVWRKYGVHIKFIFWMIKHGRNMVSEIQNQATQSLSKYGFFSIALILVAREGTEIAIFTFAGKYLLASVGLGLLVAMILSILIYKEGIIGLPLYVLLGWYSKPEWVQFILQYTYTLGMFAFWYKWLGCQKALVGHIHTTYSSGLFN